MPCYTPFLEDTISVIEKAVKYAEEQITLNYNKKRQISEQNFYVFINHQEEQDKKKIEIIKKYLSNAYSMHAMDEMTHEAHMSLIKDALQIYMSGLKAHKIKTEMPSFDGEISEVERVLSLDSIKNSKGGILKIPYIPIISRESKKFEIFISHSSEDKSVAHALKKELENKGFSAFVAHDDIKPSEDFKNEIKIQLENCDALLAIVTDNFLKSTYCNQETGMAIIKQKTIFYVLVTKEDTGFLKDYQRLALVEDLSSLNFPEIAEKMASNIKK